MCKLFLRGRSFYLEQTKYCFFEYESGLNCRIAFSMHSFASFVFHIVHPTLISFRRRYLWCIYAKSVQCIFHSGGSPRGFWEQGNIGKISKGTGEQNSKNYSTKTF